MDYCSSCRRHLNGALVCPGCGAYAPDIAPAASHGRIAPAAVAKTMAPATDSTAWDAWYDGRPYDGPAGTDEPAGTGEPAVDTEGVPLAPEGRAARRRQRARWKKNQRRAVVATAVALVGGGLTLASMDRQSGDHTQAATAPVDPGTGVEEQTAQVTGPAGTQPEARHAASTPARSSSAGHDSGRYVTASQHTTTSNAARTDSASAPRATTVSNSPVRSTVAAASDTVSRATGTTGTTNTTGTSGTSGTSDTSGSTATTPTQTPTDTATDGTGSSGSGTSGSGTEASQSDSSTSATSPSGICVLGLLCIS
jgi:hypothetical protein